MELDPRDVGTASLLVFRHAVVLSVVLFEKKVNVKKEISSFLLQQSENMIFFKTFVFKNFCRTPLGETIGAGLVTFS